MDVGFGLTTSNGGAFVRAAPIPRTRLESPEGFISSVGDILLVAVWEGIGRAEAPWAEGALNGQ